MKQWFVYIIRTQDRRLYTGITVDLKRRFNQHLSMKKGAKFFHATTPMSIVWSEVHPDRSSATKREILIKKMIKSEKEALVANKVPYYHPSMISVSKAKQFITDNVRAIRPVKVGVLEALDHVLAEDIKSRVSLPPFDNSGMDGYAVKASDTTSATTLNPVTLKVIEVIPAGMVPTKKIRIGQAAKIMTGAMMPDGADAVVMIEKTQQTVQSCVSILTNVSTGHDVRSAGDDIKKGELIFKKGRTVSSRDVALLTAMNITNVLVFPRPKVGIIATGSELVPPGTKLIGSKIIDSNSNSLAAMVKCHHGDPILLGIAKDDPVSLRKKISKTKSCDMIIISGGVSVGDYDYVRDTLKKSGLKEIFWRIHMKPGKPLLFGILNGKPVFGIPGNPASTIVSFTQLIGPALLTMSGKKNNGFVETSALSEETISKNKGVRTFFRAYATKKGDTFHVRLSGKQESNKLKSFVDANCLLIVEEEKEVIQKGEIVSIQFFESFEGHSP